MFDFIPSYSTLVEYYEMGGFVMPPLILISVLLWYALIFRATNIRSSKNNPRELVRKARKGKKTFYKLTSTTAGGAQVAIKIANEVESPVLVKALIEEEFSKIKEGLHEYKTLVRSLVAVAPLLGLLGTVDGMIETFSSLGDMALFTQSGGIAGGISKALFTTQVGLAISIPGLLLGRIIERRERNVCLELDQVRDLICARVKTSRKKALAN